MADKADFDRLGDLLPAAAAGRAGADLPRRTPAGAADVDAVAVNRRLAAIWADVVGAEVAGNARPVQLRDGRLVVTTSSSAWAQTLQLMSEMVIARLNERLGEGTVKKAVFRHAGWEDFSPGAGVEAAGGGSAKRRTPRTRGGPDVRDAAPSADGAPLSAGAPAPVEDDGVGLTGEEQQALADLERLPLPPSVKDTIRDAMKAGFARARQDFGRS